MFSRLGSVLIFFALVCSLKGYGCTGMQLKAEDGSYVNGRTLEFGIELKADCAVVPRGYGFKAATSLGEGVAYISKYAAVGMITFGEVALLDGLNEKGLAVGTFYFPGFASYAETTAENQAKALSPTDFPNWIVTQFASCDEVKEALDGVVVVNMVGKAWGGVPAPFHYIVYDKMGKSLVIEPIDGKLVVYDNPLGVFTNSPGFDWHMLNLRNYLNLRSQNAPDLQIGSLVLTPFGQGSGMLGLPGDFTPPSRFVRAATIAHTALSAATSQDAIFQLLHFLNQFDIPKGLVREGKGEEMYVDWTSLTCARDPQTLRYYWKSYEDQTLRMVDLHHFDFDAKEVKKIAAQGDSQPVIDLSSQLQ